MSGAQIRAVAITGILSVIDGYDVLAMTFAAPGVSNAWGLGKGELGLALSSGLAGMILGSMLLAPLADRFGRRPISLLCLALMSVGMLLAALSHSLRELIACRIITGVGIGALVPIIAPLAAEYANARSRRLALAIMSLGYPVGGTIGGFVAAILLRHYDWPALFLFGAALSALMILPTFLYLIETPAILLAIRPRGALDRINDYLARCGVPPLAALPPAGVRSRRATYREIFLPERRSATLRIAAINFLFMLSVYYILSWMPQMIADNGHSASFAAAVSAITCLAGVTICLALGVIGPRIPLVWLAGSALIGLGVGTAAFGAAAWASAMMIALSILVGSSLYAATLGVFSTIVATFDPYSRATGVGFVMGVGRAAGAIAPALAGLLFTIGISRAAVSLALATGALAAACLIFANRRHHAA